MDTLKAIDKLVRLAREESGPRIDVSRRVIAEIESMRAPVRVMPFTIFAGASAAAAAVLAFVAVQAWQYMNNPVVNMFAPLQEASLW